jgi:signal transduction histidine kinase
LDGIVESTQRHLFFIIQEAFNNIRKHAEATDVSIEILLNEDTLTMIIEDNGVGFDDTMLSEGIGLENMRRRIHGLKGEIFFDSRVGRGTIINIHLKIQPFQQLKAS